MFNTARNWMHAILHHTHNGKDSSKISAENISGIIESAKLADEATVAQKLKTARSIILSGDISGSASFDGSANATIVTTIAFRPSHQRCELAANQTIPSDGSYHLVNFNSNGWSSGVYKVQKDGLFHFRLTAMQNGGTSAGTLRAMKLELNGTRMDFRGLYSFGASDSVPLDYTAELEKDDEIKAYYIQDSGSDLNLYAGLYTRADVTQLA